MSINLGAPHPWYTVVPLFVLLALAGITLGSAFERAWRRERPAWTAPIIGIASAVTLLAAATQIAQSMQPRTPELWEPFEADRREAGRFLRSQAAPGEVLECAYGWPAFESRLPVYDRAGLNSTQRLAPVVYRVEDSRSTAGQPRLNRLPGRAGRKYHALRREFPLP